MKKTINIFCFIVTIIFLLSAEASAFWVWTPKTKKLVNPKYAAKDTPEEQFKWAMSFFEEKDYKRAAEEFARLVSYFPDSEMAPEAQYYAGRSYEAAEKYYPAFEAYQKTLDLYPFTKRIDEIIQRQYNIGREIYKKHSGKLMGRELMTDLDRSVEIFEKVKKNAPFGEYGDQAQFMIGECYKKSEQFAEAVKAFQELVDAYPRSPLRDKAKYEVAHCTYLASLNPDYDQELTDDAIEEFKRIAETKKGLTIAEEAEETVSLLEDKKAESLFNAAQFYERQKKYKSAAIYYEEILNKYPRSSFSELAARKLEYMNILLGES